MQRFNYTCTFLLCISLFSFYGCRKALPVLTPPSQYMITSYNDVFESFWNGMNTNYVFWDIDTTNWDNMYRIYKPLFAQLDTSRDKSKVHKYFKDMTQGLIDGHYALDMPGGLGWTKMFYSPSTEQRKSEGRYHKNPPLFPLYTNIFNNYLTPQSRIYRYTWANKDTTIFMYGEIKSATKTLSADKILYIKFNRFKLRSSYDSIRNAIDSFLIHVHDADVTALIVDVRSNGGGNLNDMHFLVGNLIDKPLHWGYSRYKNGNGRLDYTPWVKNIVTPQTRGRSFNKPIVVLVDVQTVSMGEMTTLALQAMPAGKTVVIGERTWGGLGGLTTYDSPNYNGGKFTFGFSSLADEDKPYGEVYTPSGASVDMQMRSYEGKGISPSIVVPYDEESRLGIKDAPLDRAIEYIRTAR